jgi:hypothetical protein
MVAVLFVAVLGAVIAVPFVAFAWAMKRRVCPHCGGAIEPEEELVRAFMGPQ